MALKQAQCHLTKPGSSQVLADHFGDHLIVKQGKMLNFGMRLCVWQGMVLEHMHLKFPTLVGKLWDFAQVPDCNEAHSQCRA